MLKLRPALTPFLLPSFRLSSRMGGRRQVPHKKRVKRTGQYRSPETVPSITTSFGFSRGGRLGARWGFRWVTPKIEVEPDPEDRWDTRCPIRSKGSGRSNFSQLASLFDWLAGWLARVSSHFTRRCESAGFAVLQGVAFVYHLLDIAIKNPER